MGANISVVRCSLHGPTPTSVRGYTHAVENDLPCTGPRVNGCMVAEIAIRLQGVNTRKGRTSEMCRANSDVKLQNRRLRRHETRARSELCRSHSCLISELLAIRAVRDGANSDSIAIVCDGQRLRLRRLPFPC